jgi:hypothetical protein
MTYTNIQRFISENKISITHINLIFNFLNLNSILRPNNVQPYYLIFIKQTY